MVIEKIAYFCEIPGCDHHSFSKLGTENHEKIPIKEDSIGGLILAIRFDKRYTVVRPNGNLTYSHEPLYTWDKYKEVGLKEINPSEIDKKMNNSMEKLFGPSRGFEKETVLETLLGETSRTSSLKKGEFEEVTAKLKKLYPKRYPRDFKFKRTISK